MAMFSTIALATRGRIIPAGYRRSIAMATLGWILVTGTPVPPSGGGDHGPDTVKPVGGSGRHKRIVETSHREQLLREDQEILAIIMTYAKNRML